MLILLYGEDTFRLKEKLREIINGYQAKHQSGLNLICFEETNLDFDNFKNSVEAVSMFDEKKLIVLKNILENKNFQEDFLKYIKKNKVKNNQDVIVVVCQEGKMKSLPLKRQASMFEEFKPLDGIYLTNWIRKRVTQNQMKIDPTVIRKLIAHVGNDLWQLNNEVNKLMSYKSGELIELEDIDLLVKAKMDVNIFHTLDALAQKDKKTALRLLHEHLAKGENEIYLFTMFIYQLRNLLKLKDLTERGVPFNGLAKKSGLHPFVVKKSVAQLGNFDLDQLKRIYRKLLNVERKLKVGRIDGTTALDMLVVAVF